jgi:hypothetical protein
VNKTKTLKMKLIYIVAAVAMLAMLIPAMAIPASAANTYAVQLTTVGGDPDGGYNITGFDVVATLWLNGSVAPTGTASAWSLQNNSADASFVGTDPNTITPRPSTVTVVDDLNAQTQLNGETTINAYVGGVKVASADKKWAFIDHTVLTDPGTNVLTWNQTDGSWNSTTTVTDTVYGTFPTVHTAQGTILNWFLLDSNDVMPAHGANTDPGKVYEAQSWINAILGYAGPPAVPPMQPATFAEFLDLTTNAGMGTNIQTTTDATGTSTVKIGSWGAEGIRIVVIPEYPNDPQINIVPEVTIWTTSIAEMESVPQVRWIGEKIVLEKNFGASLAGSLVNFTVTTGSDDAILEPMNSSIDTASFPQLMNLSSNGRSVWTVVDDTGVASVILTSDVPEQVSVRLAFYGESGDFIIAQSSFTVYFLKFETLTLSDVVGKRAGHFTGIWQNEDGVDANPYNQQFPAADTSDLTTQDRNVSQDALERAQVRGWFMGVNMSTRPEQYLNPELASIEDSPVTDADTITLPKGRWVLPDDWVKLAGGLTKWQTKRVHWDIMDSPSDLVVSTDLVTLPFGTGAYIPPGTISPVIGPFTPGIEVMTPTGWDLGVTSPDPDRQYKTVVPNGALDAWDAPMPPAKIVFDITDGNGYFKETMKSDIYVTENNSVKEYTSPFYAEMIPAHWAIPAFYSGNDGYSWDSFNPLYGPYVFWTKINLPASQAIVPSSDWDGHPTALEVYSDNHGEAMAYLNGDWNLDLDSLGLLRGKDGADISSGTIVGNTTVQATADYPTIRQEQEISSNTVEKIWHWGGMVLGIDSHTYADGIISPASLNIISAGSYTQTEGTAGSAEGKGYSNDHTIFIWATDRDGLINGMLGAQVDWTIVGGAWLQTYHSINNKSVISHYNAITENIFLNNNGFLDGTTGVVTNPDKTMGTSFFTTPSIWENLLFYKNWGTGNTAGNPVLYTDPTGHMPTNFAVAAIDINQVNANDITINIDISGTDFGYTGQPVGQVDYTTNLLGGNTGIYPLDDPIVAGDANNDGKVNAADITAVERIIAGLDPIDVNADTNMNGTVDMGDVVKIIRIIMASK